MYVSQVINGILLPVVLVFMLVLINDRRIMGEHVNSLLQNVVSVVLSVAIAGLAIGSAVLMLAGR